MQDLLNNLESIQLQLERVINLLVIYTEFIEREGSYVNKKDDGNRAFMFARRSQLYSNLIDTACAITSEQKSELTEIIEKTYDEMKKGEVA